MKCGCWARGLLAGLAGFACAARAEPWEVVYDGTVFPEAAGWQRITYGGGAQRWIEDGCLVLDGRASSDISDFYRKAIASGPGFQETYFTRWRLRVDDVVGFTDPAVGVMFQHGALILGFQENRIYSLLEAVWIDFAPGVFHDYVLLSHSMVEYSLYIDGALVHEGHFVGPAYTPRVEWGDATQGAKSLSVWDYVQFGVVPEPSGAALGSLTLGALVTRTSIRMRNRRVNEQVVDVRDDWTAGQYPGTRRAGGW